MYSLIPACRTPRVRGVIVKLSRQLHAVLKKYDLYVYTDRYKEQINGSKARVNYTVRVSTYDGAQDKQAAAFHDQLWVLRDGRWFMDCRTL